MINYDWYDKARNLVIAFSNENKKLIQVETNEEYTEAIDLFDHYEELNGELKPMGKYHYIESEKDIKKQ